MEGLAFPEAPRWHEGALYFSDQHLRRVFRLEGEEPRVVCDVAGRPSGLGWDRNGDLIVVSMDDRRVLRHRDGEHLEEIADLSGMVGGPLNDLVTDDHHRAYVGSMGSDVQLGRPLTPTVLVRVDPEGAAHVVARDLVFPNGMVIAPDGRTLVVAESFAMRLTAFRVGEDGSLSDRREWARLATPPGTVSIPAAIARGGPIPDGICMDVEGKVWVADPRGRAVLRVAEGGAVVDRIRTGRLGSYAVALGGDDRRTLYVCANLPLHRLGANVGRFGAVLACRIDVPGGGRP